MVTCAVGNLCSDGKADLKATADAQLGEHAPQVGLDGWQAEVERGGDLGVSQTLGYRDGNLALPISELCKAGVGLSRR